MWLIVACGGPDGKDLETGDTGPDDTGLVDTGESGESGDTEGESGDPPPPPEATLTFLTESDAHPLTLFSLDLRSSPPEVGLPWLAAPGGSPLELAIPRPPEELLIEVDPEGLPGLYAAFFLPTLHADDGDGVYSPGEVLEAAGLAWPVYLDGAIPIELVALGFLEGWNALVLDAGEDGAPVEVPIDAIPLPSNVAVRDELDIAGVGVDIPEGAEIGLFTNYPTDPEQVPPVVSTPLAETWSLATTGATGHREEFDSVGIYGDLTSLAVWSDEDGDAVGDGLSELLWGVCQGDAVLGALWIEPVEDPAAALLLATAGIPAGWTAVRFGEGGTVVLTDAERLAIDASGACPM